MAEILKVAAVVVVASAAASAILTKLFIMFAQRGQPSHPANRQR